MKKRGFLAFLLSSIFTIFSVAHTYAFGNINTIQSVITVGIGEGHQTTILPFNLSTNYQEGDSFSYDNKIGIVTGSGFNEASFLNPDGTVNMSYVRPYGPISEDTNEWRSYNTYAPGDIVTYNGYSGEVRHEGANSATPGSNVNSGQRLGENGFMYNTYATGSIVLYNTKYYRSLTENRNKIPGQVNGAGILI